MGISKTETNSLIDVLNDGSRKFGGLSRAECPPADRLWRIVLLKVTYYATSSARKFAKLCQNYGTIPKLCS